jgi:2'-5' RNA ligase/GNAT superfamily N-acetyltransferase
VDGLRRAVGDKSLGRVPPHLTLVPPVNVRGERLEDALAVLRAAAAETPAVLRLTLGGVATFLPANPVLYLSVSGDRASLDRLRDRVFAEPLARPLTWPFVPHVTLADDADPVVLSAAPAVLAGYSRVSVPIDRVYLLEEVRVEGHRVWRPVADVAFGPPAVVGRGGPLALELVRGSLIDPVAAAALDAHGASVAVDGIEVAGSAPRVVVTGLREGHVVGVATAWLGPDGGRVCLWVVPAHRRQGIGGHLLAAVEAAVADAGWGCSRLSGVGPAAFYAARSRFSVGEPPSLT